LEENDISRIADEDNYSSRIANAKVLNSNSRKTINVSRIPILHNAEFTIVDIGGVVNHHCLNFLFVMPQANGSLHLCYNKLII
jgi:hypothetical protein